MVLIAKIKKVDVVTECVAQEEQQAQKDVTEEASKGIRNPGRKKRTAN